MIDHHGSWLPSVTFGVPVLGVLALIALATVIICAFFYRGDYDGQIPVGIGAAIVLLGVLISSGFGYWPLHGDYHRLQPVTGSVTAVDSRFLAASQYVVVTYDGGRVVRCDDSRCATVRVGEQLRLLCTKEHQFGSPLEADGWACRWGQQN